MLTQVRTLPMLLLALFMSALPLGCSKNGQAPAAPPVASPAKAEPEKAPSSTVMSHVLASGDAVALKMFNEKMGQIEGVPNLEDAFIACNECGKLDDPAPPSALNYYYPVEQTAKPGKFLQAWRSVKDAGKKISLTLDDDLSNIRHAACPPSPPAPVCFSAPWCYRTDQCDKSLGTAGCQQCI